MSMMRKTGPEADVVYRLARSWAQRCLRQPGSLFAPDGVECEASSPSSAQALHRAFVDHPQLGHEKFVEKLAIQLRGEPTDVVQLAAELLFIHFLVAQPGTIGGAAKRAVVNAVLQFDEATVPMPIECAQALDHGLGNMGQGFLSHRNRQFELLAAVVLQLSLEPDDRRAQLLADPWAFRDFIDAMEVKSAQIQRSALLHMLFPDDMARIWSQEHRHRLVATFGPDAQANTADEERNLVVIDRYLSSNVGGHDKLPGDGHDAARWRS